MVSATWLTRVVDLRFESKIDGFLANKNDREASAAFINSVNDIPEAATRVRSLIIIKAEIDGQTKMVFVVLTTNQLIQGDCGIA